MAEGGVGSGAEHLRVKGYVVSAVVLAGESRNCWARHPEERTNILLLEPYAWVCLGGIQSLNHTPNMRTEPTYSLVLQIYLKTLGHTK